MKLDTYECGECGTEFDTNCDPSDIACPECGARMCPHCQQWIESA